MPSPPAASIEALLAWSSRQAHILTGGGVAERLYTAARGFPHEPGELPHHHLVSGTTHSTFESWQQAAALTASDQASALPPSWLIGAWARPLFAGGGLRSTDDDEMCCNLVTRSLFIDIRVPTLRDVVLSHIAWDEIASAERAGVDRPLATLSDLDIRLLARQHAFGGYGLCAQAATLDSFKQPSEEFTCTRHHVIDWNFVGALRPRPNKWRVRPTDAQQLATLASADGGGGGRHLAGTGALLVDGRRDGACDDWLELSFADDDGGLPYYYERWQRHDGGEGEQTLALRLRRLTAGRCSSGGGGGEQDASSDDAARDALIVVVGDRFGYLISRPSHITHQLAQLGPSLVAAVDEAIGRGDCLIAEANPKPSSPASPFSPVALTLTLTRHPSPFTRHPHPHPSPVTLHPSPYTPHPTPR